MEERLKEVENLHRLGPKDYKPVKNKRHDEFRIRMPYGCNYDEENKNVFYYNRNYKHIGSETRLWATHMLQDKKHYSFYDDMTKPLSSKKALKRYKALLTLFKDYKIVTHYDDPIKDTAPILYKLESFESGRTKREEL